MAKSLISGTSTCCTECGYKNRKYHKRKDNNFYNNGEYIIGKLKSGENFIVDISDYEKVSKIYWRKTENGYLYGKKNNEFILFHRLILENELSIYDSKIDVDHINHNKLDNRKSNLRIVTRSQNNMNRTPINVYGINGVSFQSNINKYVARITINDNAIHLGSYERVKDAINARKQAEEKYFGEYSYANSMMEDNK